MEVTSSEEPELSTDDQRLLDQWQAVALVHGMNELVKTAGTLGEKLFFRLFRDKAEKHAATLGIQFQCTHNPVVLTLPGTMRPDFVFYEQDIELMRKTVADWDSSHSGL
jgi:hypothetical protein